MENRHLVDHALSRWITILECELSRWLPEGQKVKFNMTDLVRPTLPERTKSYQISGGNKPWMTIQEIRQAEGLPEIDLEELQPAADIQPPEIEEEEEDAPQPEEEEAEEEKEKV